ncbi:hypothetical protein I4F81_012185 [Pyropia yezoensis]|uniref:Uncharacterized protein n=1 Tax=Pyropia yezoensis TaxID=2788 RepID=A0ACC3CIS9_PYRYE|nr:hypothetical protein I4F81_012185 [Neopyropia yezoensis]
MVSGGVRGHCGRHGAIKWPPWPATPGHTGRLPPCQRPTPPPPQLFQPAGAPPPPPSTPPSTPPPPRVPSTYPSHRRPRRPAGAPTPPPPPAARRRPSRRRGRSGGRRRHCPRPPHRRGRSPGSAGGGGCGCGRRRQRRRPPPPPPLPPPPRLPSRPPVNAVGRVAAPPGPWPWPGGERGRGGRGTSRGQCANARGERAGKVKGGMRMRRRAAAGETQCACGSGWGKGGGEETHQSRVTGGGVSGCSSPPPTGSLQRDPFWSRRRAARHVPPAEPPLPRSACPQWRLPCHGGAEGNEGGGAGPPIGWPSEQRRPRRLSSGEARRCAKREEAGREGAGGAVTRGRDRPAPPQPTGG